VPLGDAQRMAYTYSLAEAEQSIRAIAGIFYWDGPFLFHIASLKIISW